MKKINLDYLLEKPKSNILYASRDDYSNVIDIRYKKPKKKNTNYIVYTGSKVLFYFDVHIFYKKTKIRIEQGEIVKIKIKSIFK